MIIICTVSKHFIVCHRCYNLHEEIGKVSSAELYEFGTGDTSCTYLSQKLAVEMRAKFPDVDIVMANVKKGFVKAT